MNMCHLQHLHTFGILEKNIEPLVHNRGFKTDVFIWTHCITVKAILNGWARGRSLFLSSMSLSQYIKSIQFKKFIRLLAKNNFTNILTHFIYIRITINYNNKNKKILIILIIMILIMITLLITTPFIKAIFASHIYAFC